MMESSPWPTKPELDRIRKWVAELAGRGTEEVRIVVSPYRICPLGAHIDHQGGTVSAMTINKGVLLGFIPSDDSQVLIRSGQFKGEVRFRVDEIQERQDPKTKKSLANGSQDAVSWGCYAKGAVYALQRGGNDLKKGIIGCICGSEGLDSSGLSSSAAVGVAYLLALESANEIVVPPIENVEYDRLIENEYLGLKNGILDQSAILLSSSGCLLCMNCKTKEHRLIHSSKLQNNQCIDQQKAYKILLAFSGLKHALTNNPGYNSRVAECQEAAKVLLQASGNSKLEPILSNVKLQDFQAHKEKLEPILLRRAEHYFSENSRVLKGLDLWASGNLEDFGALISLSGFSSIKNYECGSQPLIDLYEIMLKAPGVYGARFSGAGFRGCCIGLVDADQAEEAASFVRHQYQQLQPELASQIIGSPVLICSAGDCAHIV
uniref:Galacturonokinase n=1 Tax=Kalanchoe fedtschenkoi TaxID=63787 RepID=A0A7N0VG01_KALFE